MNHRFRVLLAATISAAFLSPSAQAQTNPGRPNLGVPQEEFVASQWKAFRIRNVPASLMASWLTPPPKTAPRPAFMPQIAAPISYEIPPTWAVGHSASETAEFLALPAGVQTVAAVDTQNILWVLGTPIGLQKIAEKVVLLDTPLRQVEVEAQCIRISDADIKTLGIDFAKGEGAIETGTAGPNIQDQIAALIAQKRAKIITAPRVLATFGATATLRSVTDTPILLIPKDETGYLMQQLKQAGLPQEDQLLMFVSSSIELTVTPTFNTDGTIAVQMGPLRTIGLRGSKPNVKVHNVTDSDRIVLKDPDAIPTKPFILKDKQTVALRGLNWSLGENGFPNAPNAQTMSVLVLVTPRIVRRAEDAVVAALPR